MVDFPPVCKVNNFCEFLSDLGHITPIEKGFTLKEKKLLPWACLLWHFCSHWVNLVVTKLATNISASNFEI